jgi:hypothetical protein
MLSASRSAPLASANERPSQARTGNPQTNADAGLADGFRKQVDQYAQLHKRLEAMLPKLPKDATPQQIDRDQRALEQLIVQARRDAKPGEFFNADMQTLVRRRFAVIFQGARGRQIKKYIHDEPHPVAPVINKRYPDVVPLSTMPLSVLAQLPKLPDELEYRFIANHLILMDVHAHVILDYMLNAIPADTPAPQQ